MSSVVPEGWKLLPIGDVTAFSQGIQVDVEQHHEKEDDSKVRFVRISDYTKSHEPPRYIDSSLALKGLVEKDDVVMIRYGEAGRVCRGIVGAIANNLFTIRPNSILEKEYLFQYLTSKEVSQRIGELAASSAMPAISFSSLKSINLTVPPLPEQKKIASILTSVDEVIENTQKQIDKLQDLKKATMNELLTKGIGHTEFKDSELGRIPEGWTKERLGKYVKIESGNSFQSSEFSDKGIPIVRISNIRNGKIDLSNAVFCEENKRLEKFLIANGDILLAMSGATTGKIGKYTCSFKSYLNQRVGRFKVIDETKVENEYVYQLVRSREFTENTLIDAIGGAQPNISSSQVENVVYKFPPLPEQKKIASILTSMDKTIEEKQRKLHQTQSLKKSLMQDLLTGRVRVTVN
ncbi:restriction endonuclease subunit S [Hellea sp.]|nr:restriction endonuclease subunit S [Hellea sp.]MDB4844713.1 restriction endonuclease subunit S [Hellea sp.]